MKEIIYKASVHLGISFILTQFELLAIRTGGQVISLGRLPIRL